MQLFHYDNPVMLGISKIANCILLSLLWLIGCIPVITVGASTCALYYTVEKNIKNDRGYVISSFLHAYKENLGQATIVSVIFLIAELILQSDFWILEELGKTWNVFGSASAFFKIVMGLLLVYMVWVFAMLGRFENRLLQIMKNSFILMVHHWVSSFAIALCLAFGCAVVWLIPLAVCLMPVVVFWFISIPIERAFHKYLS